MPQFSTSQYRHSTTLLAVLAALVFFCTDNALGRPIAEYQQNLKSAITALDTLAQIDEDESTSDYENRFNQTLAGVRAALPQYQVVELGEEVYNVNNAWLHKALDELTEAVDRPKKLEVIIETLRALETRVAERLNPGVLVDSKDQAKSKLENILARPEYASATRGPNALTRLIRDFLQWLQKFFPKRRTAQTGLPNWVNVVAQIAVVVLGLLVLVFVLRVLLKRFQRPGRIKPRKKQKSRIILGERLEPDQTASDLLSEAEALARRGELRAAIRKAYIALLVELGDRKIISLAQHKTNRDYLNALRDVPQLHSNMRGLTDSFERHWYGFAEASESDWQNFREGYLAALHGGN